MVPKTQWGVREEGIVPYIDEGCKVPVVPVVSALTVDEATREAAREALRAGRNPVLTYSGLDGAKIEATLGKLRGIVIPDELPEPVRAVVAAKVRHTTRVAEMLLATDAGDNELHHALSLKAYGEPDVATFWGIVKRQGVPGLNVPAGIVPSELPDHSVVQRLSGRVCGSYMHVLDMIPDGKYDADGIVAAMNEVIAWYPVLVEDGWRAEINPDKGSITAINDQQVVAIPPGRQLSSLELRCRVVHEVLTHAFRRSNGARSILKMLMMGFPEYIEGEDGLALFREQCLRGVVEEYDRWDYYLSIGLAMGLDGTPRDFRGVFKIMLDIYARTAELPWAAEAALERCIRVFRGTNGQQTGLCNTKDIAYYAGCQRMWANIPTLLDEWPRLDCGKYDPTDELHRACLDALDIR